MHTHLATNFNKPNIPGKYESEKKETEKEEKNKR